MAAGNHMFAVDSPPGIDKLAAQCWGRAVKERAYALGRALGRAPVNVVCATIMYSLPTYLQDGWFFSLFQRGKAPTRFCHGLFQAR